MVKNDKNIQMDKLGRRYQIFKTLKVHTKYDSDAKGWKNNEGDENNIQQNPNKQNNH